LAAISSEHDTDQATLDSADAAFAVVEGERATYQTQIEDAVAGVGIEWNAATGAWQKSDSGLCTDVPVCRETESALCLPCGECHEECTIHTQECLTVNLELEEAHADVINVVTIPAYCVNDVIHPPSSETYETQVDMTDHLLNKEKMEIYLRLLADWGNCTDDPTTTTVCTECPPPPAHPPSPSTCGDHDDQVVTCDTMTNELFAAQCQARFTVSNHLALYQAAFTARLGRYNQVRTQVMIMEADRKVEWDTLERVICLLNVLTVEEDGAAASATSEARINACRLDDIPEASVGVLATGAHSGHLDIQYPVPPGMGDLPGVPPSPCEQDFRDICMPEGLPATCGGVTEFVTLLGGGGSDVECSCTAEAPTPIEIGFPYQLGPFLVFDTGFALNSADGFSVNAATAQWTARMLTVSAQDYQGRLSPFVPVTLPDLDLAFGLTGTDVVAQIAWAYPDTRGTQDINALVDGTETMAHRFLRTGGFVYRNEAGIVVALKEISPTETALGQNPELSLNFAAPEVITEAQANTACPVMNVPAGHLNGEGAEEYCWDKSSTIDICSQEHRTATTTDAGATGTHGCYLFKVITTSTFTDETTTSWIAFAVTEAPVWNEAAHYAGTDQQGAAIASMITGQHDYMQWAQTRQQLGMVTEPRNR